MSKPCSNDVDLFTQEPWSESPPDVFIDFGNQEDKQKCYSSSNLSVWLKDRDNFFVEWISKDPNKPMDNSGHDGKPDPDSPYYVKLFTQEFLVFDESVDLLANGLKNVSYEAEFLGSKRLGNLEGLMTMSGLHGQYPGYNVYQLKNEKLLNPETEKLKEEILDSFEERELLPEGEYESDLEEEVEYESDPEGGFEEEYEGEGEESRYFTRVIDDLSIQDTEVLDPEFDDMLRAELAEMMSGDIAVIIPSTRTANEDDPPELVNSGVVNIGKIVEVAMYTDLPEDETIDGWDEINKQEYDNLLANNRIIDNLFM